MELSPQEVTEENVRVVSQARSYTAGSYSLEMISITVKGLVHLLSELGSNKELIEPIRFQIFEWLLMPCYY